METLRDRIIVKLLKEGKQKVGRIAARKRGEHGKVIIVGTEKTEESGQRTDRKVEEGDVIPLGKYSGQEVNLDGVEYLILRQDEVLAVLDSPSRTRQIRPAQGRTTMLTPDPEQVYIPSENLVSLLKRRSPVFSKDEAAALRDQARSGAGSSVRDKDLPSFIGERIEGLLGNLARRAAASGRKVVLLANERRFSPEFSAELVDRLGVDPYSAPEFLHELHRDLSEFAAVPRVRSWGRIETKRGNLVLPVAVERAKRPDFSDLFERSWAVTK